eukprot:227243-Chlamydomonas_euryale.AAC.2
MHACARALVQPATHTFRPHLVGSLQRRACQVAVREHHAQQHVIAGAGGARQRRAVRELLSQLQSKLVLAHLAKEAWRHVPHNTLCLFSTGSAVLVFWGGRACCGLWIQQVALDF